MDTVIDIQQRLIDKALDELFKKYKLSGGKEVSLSDQLADLRARMSIVEEQLVWIRGDEV